MTIQKNKNNPDPSHGPSSARERLRAEQEREQAKARRFKVLKIGVAVTVVLAIAGGAGVLLAQRPGGEEAPAADAKPVTVGRAAAPAKLTVFEDFRCPACGSFENVFRKTVNSLEKQGKLKTEYHLVTIIDGNMGGSGSKNAANAALCARDEGRFKPFHDTLFMNQPMETQDRFADKGTLLKLGKKAGVDSASFRSCVGKGTYDKTAEAGTAKFRTSGHSGTPTVLLDGKTVYGPGKQLTPAQLQRKVENATGKPAAGAAKGTADKPSAGAAKGAAGKPSAGTSQGAAGEQSGAAKGAEGQAPAAGEAPAASAGQAPEPDAESRRG